MNYTLIVSIVGLVLLISTIFFITLKHKDSKNSSKKSMVIREYLTNEPSLLLTTVYGQRPPTSNFLNWKAGQLPI
jgi:predicted permease